MTLQLDNHFVAFIDLLGFSDMVQSDCESPDEPKYLDLLYRVHQDAPTTLGSDIESGLIQFSDSIVFSRPFELPQLEFFIGVVADWQKSLLHSGLLCRGGVTFGKHFVKDRFMFSKGLIDAYRLEATRAQFPRIVISEDLIQLASTKIDITGLPTVQEEDSVTFVDYLSFASETERQDLESAVRRVCDKKNPSASVREKLRWLAHYADYKLGTQLAGPRFS